MLKSSSVIPSPASRITSKTLAILVGGGPAPGINGVIRSATIEAINLGCKVLGIYDGYKWLSKGSTRYVERLTIDACRGSITGAAPSSARPGSTRPAIWR